MSRLFFRKSQRISSEKDFKRVLAGRTFVCRGVLRLYAAANGLECSRFGVSVGQRCGDAVERNRLKRLAREVFRLHQHQIPPGVDYILIFTTKMPKIKTDNPENRSNRTQDICFEGLERDFLNMIDVLGKR